MEKRNTILMLFFLILLTGCSVENVDPEFFGIIEGQVLNSETQKGISFASVTTNPGTEAVLTNENGEFLLTNIPVGDYLVQVTKEGYRSESVRVTVRRSDTTSAQILLDEDKESKPPQDFLKAEVNSFYNNTTDGDTTYVEVNYSITNRSNNEAISNYEIYFKIVTPKEEFLHEVHGDSLHSGQSDVGSYKKYIRNYKANSVVITGIYAPPT